MGRTALRLSSMAIWVAAGLALSAPAAICQSAADFYRGKTISFYVGSGEGGGLDLYPRLLADYLTRYMPGNPSVIVRYLPGAGGVKAANFIYRVGPQDGTAYGFVTRGVIYAPLFHVPQAEFDPTRINWVGSTAKEVSIGAVWSASTDVRTIGDATRREVVVGANSVGNDSGVFPIVLNEFLGTRFKVVHGYKSGADISLALERGEVQGRVGWSVGSLLSGSTADWLGEKKVTVLIQLGLFKHKNLPASVPLALDLARSPEDRRLMELIFAATSIGWPSFLGPDVPKERVAAVRAAYRQALRDPGLLATAKKQRLEIDPLTSGDIEGIIAEMYGTPEPMIERARTIMKYTGVE
jgi:tripartite-type tricarboxylate transporter receptor subunit TctC